MEDPVLNQSLEETRELHTRWGQFRDFVLMAVKSRKVTAQAEMKFLELKSRIAMLHDGFIARLDHDQKTGQNIMSIVADCILLKRCAGYTDAEKQKFEFDWNECYLLLTEQLGALEEEQKRLANINVRAYNAQKRRELMVAQFHNALRSIYVKLGIGAFALFMLLWGIPAFGIFDYKTLGTISATQKPYAMFTNFIWRPYISEDLQYMSEGEVRMRVEKDWGKETNGAIGPNDGLTKKLTPDNFMKTELPPLGLKGQQLKDAQDLFKRAKFNAQGYKASNADAKVFWLYFPDVKSATDFTTALIDAAKALPEAKHQALLNQYVLLRRANLVTMGDSTHPHRYWAGEKFYFENAEQNNLLK